MKRLNVLYLPLQDIDPIWKEEIVKAVSPRHNLAIYDRRRPLAAQFAGVDVVLDMGGSVGTREMYDAATDAKLWQIIGTGLDHIDVAYMKTKGFAVANRTLDFAQVYRRAERAVRPNETITPDRIPLVMAMLPVRVILLPLA